MSWLVAKVLLFRLTEDEGFWKQGHHDGWTMRNEHWQLMSLC